MSLQKITTSNLMKVFIKKATNIDVK